MESVIDLTDPSTNADELNHVMASRRDHRIGWIAGDTAPLAMSCNPSLINDAVARVPDSLVR